MISVTKREQIANGNEPTFTVCWKDDNLAPGEEDHEIELGTIVDIMHIVADALEGNAWDIQIAQNDAEEDAA